MGLQTLPVLLVMCAVSLYDAAHNKERVMQRVVCIISYIVVLAVFCASAAFAVGWEPAIPTPSNLPYLGLRAIAAKSDSNIVAVGAEGAFAYYDETGWAGVGKTDYSFER